MRNAILFLPLLVLLVSACETGRQCTAAGCPSDEEILAAAGAVRLTPAQVRARISGKTEEWRHGGAYYLADGSLQVKWRKVYYKATWELDDNGNVCYKLPEWQRRCHFYMKGNGEVYRLDEGENVGVAQTYAGNRLKDLGRNLPVLERKK